MSKFTVLLHSTVSRSKGKQHSDLGKGPVNSFLGVFAPCYGFRNPGNFCFWNPESGKNYAYLIRNPGFWNLEYSSRNPESHKRFESRIKFLLSNTGIHYLESGIHSVEPRIQDCPGFPCIGRGSVASWLAPHHLLME